MTEKATPPGGWAISHVAETGSTQTDLVGAAAQGGADRTVLVTDRQAQGKGRLGRSWNAPVASSLMFSVLLRPDGVPVARRGWIGALLGLAAVEGIGRRTGLAASLKWPNDVLVDGRKTAGILAELAGEALVVGMGLNVTVAAVDLPRADTTSLLVAGAEPGDCDRDELLGVILESFGSLVDRWRAAAGDMDAAGLRGEYLAASATVGERVRLELPGGQRIAGMAVDVAPDGALVIDVAGRRRHYAAGDVTHARLAVNETSP